MNMSAHEEISPHPGAVVRRLRRLHRLSQEELARRLGVSRATLANIELGQNAPSYHTTHLLALAFGVSAATFFERTTDPTLSAS